MDELHYPVQTARHAYLPSAGSDGPRASGLGGGPSQTGLAGLGGGASGQPAAGVAHLALAKLGNGLGGGGKRTPRRTRDPEDGERGFDCGAAAGGGASAADRRYERASSGLEGAGRSSGDTGSNDTAMLADVIPAALGLRRGSSRSPRRSPDEMIRSASEIPPGTPLGTPPASPTPAQLPRTQVDA